MGPTNSYETSHLLCGRNYFLGSVLAGKWIHSEIALPCIALLWQSVQPRSYSPFAQENETKLD